MNLLTEPLSRVRGLAQSLGVKDVFGKTRESLIEEIRAKQQEYTPPVKTDIPQPEYDARLMSRPPAKKSDETIIRDFLKPYTDLGMHLSFDHERWYISHGKRSDEGTLRMPPRVILDCARRLMS